MCEHKTFNIGALVSYVLLLLVTYQKKSAAKNGAKCLIKFNTL